MRASRTRESSLWMKTSLSIHNDSPASTAIFQMMGQVSARRGRPKGSDQLFATLAVSSRVDSARDSKHLGHGPAGTELVLRKRTPFRNLFGFPLSTSFGLP
jgi:hypothetical protein